MKGLNKTNLKDAAVSAAKLVNCGVNIFTIETDDMSEEVMNNMHGLCILLYEDPELTTQHLCGYGTLMFPLNRKGLISLANKLPAKLIKALTSELSDVKTLDAPDVFGFLKKLAYDNGLPVAEDSLTDIVNLFNVLGSDKFKLILWTYLNNQDDIKDLNDLQNNCLFCKHSRYAKHLGCIRCSKFLTEIDSDMTAEEIGASYTHVKISEGVLVSSEITKFENRNCSFARFKKLPKTCLIKSDKIPTVPEFEQVQLEAFRENINIDIL